jgi:trimeric autotransporter adhesin
MRLFVAVLALAAPAFGQGISCSYAVTPTTFTIGNLVYVGADSISVTPSGGSFCDAWPASVAPGVNWLHITSGSSGSGVSTVSWTADANPVGADRKGAMTVAGVAITVSQSAKVCDISVSPTSASFLVGGGTGKFQVTANCSWQAASSDHTFLPVPTGTNGNTSATVNYTIAPNSCVTARSGLITIQTGLPNPPTITITQDGSPANMTLSALSATAGPAASDGRVVVSTGNGCVWNASSDVSWMLITASAGNGNGGIGYHILANSLATRTGNIHVTPAGTIGGLLFTVTQTVAGPPAPVVTAVGNAASYAASAVSPGEIVTIFGSGMGPASPAIYQLTGGGFPTSIAGTQVLFDGVAAPMLFTSQGQVSAMAPYGLAGKNSTNLQVQYQGLVSAAIAMPVQPATPGIFSQDASGRGPGAILNQDSSINQGQRPAAIGDVVAIYCTGGGVTNPATVDGSITAGTLPLPILTQNVSVTIGGLPAKVDYSGGAPQSVAGLTQINVEVPSGVQPGSSVPVVVKVGTAQSQAGITMAVR